MIYVRLFFEFFKTGLFTVGGGMATIPFLYQISDSTGWFTHNDLANMIAVSESTPGPIGVNMATYVGFLTGNQHGTAGAILGAIVATLGLIAPSIIVILLVAMFLKNFKDNKYVTSAFYGLRPASMGLIAAAGVSVVLSTLFLSNVTTSSFRLSAINWTGLALGVVLWFLTNKVKKTKGLHPIVFIGMAAVVGIVFQM